MKHLIILKKKEVKQMLNWLENHFGIEESIFSFFDHHVFLLSPKQKIYVITKEAFHLPLETLHVDTLGMYFATKEQDGYRLSIEGSQMLGPYAREHILEIDETTMRQWMEGIDLDRTAFAALSNGYYLVKWQNDFLGCAKVVDKKILNYVPKPRRIILS